MDRSASRTWRRPRRLGPRTRAAVAVGVVAYLAAAAVSLRVDVARVAEGLPRALDFAAGFVRPDFATRGADLARGIGESLAITAIATAIGVALSIPLGVGAARNLAPLPVYLGCRAVVTLARGFQEILVAILFVVVVGFGPLAGVLTLVVAGVGFVAKLLAEEIEAIDPAPLEAIRATGATAPRVLLFGVVPQVLPRFAGLAVYRLDINFRESAVIGVVGAGGIGATLNTAFERYEFDTAAAILISIFAIVLVGELCAGRIRKSLL